MGLIALMVLCATLWDFAIKISPNLTRQKLPNNLSGISALQSGKKLMKTSSKAKGRLECIHGIRFLSMTWVLLSHTLSLGVSLPPVKNLVEYDTMFNPMLFRVVLNGYSCIDSFYLLSGMLVAYLSFRELDRTNGRINWILFYFHRYVRMTGIYAVVIGFHATLLRYFTFGPTNTVGRFVEGCQIAWWRNLIYINNLDMDPNVKSSNINSFVRKINCNSYIVHGTYLVFRIRHANVFYIASYVSPFVVAFES